VSGQSCGQAAWTVLVLVLIMVPRHALRACPKANPGAARRLGSASSVVVRAGRIGGSLQWVLIGPITPFDDFGTGWSSLAALRRYPVDILKLDRSLIASIDCDEQAAAVTRAVVAMARALGHVVVAEGIERPDQAAALRELGCELGQGYLSSRPVGADEAVRLLRASPTAAAA
jgi:EAL domain-containing protein